MTYSEAGEGRPLVILHGLFGAGRNWGAVARKFAESFKVYLVDLPNHGDSPWVESMNYEFMAEAVADFLRARGLYGPTCLLGHSMGGKTAMVLALTDPASIERLIVVDTAPVAYGGGHGNAAILEALMALPVDRIKSRSAIDAALAPAIPDPMLRSYLLANLRRDGDKFDWRINLEGLKRSLPALLGFPKLDDRSYGGATLAIEGGRSDYVRVQDRAVMRSLFPKVRFETVPDAGHWVHADAPEAVGRLVADFMAD